MVTLGFVSDGKSDAIDDSAEIKGRRLQWFPNNYLGGLAGHKIALNVCETHQTPSGATDCTTNMVQAKVPIVLAGVSGQAGAVYQGIKDAGVPFLQYGALDQGILAGPAASVFVLTNSIATADRGSGGDREGWGSRAPACRHGPYRAARSGAG